jgi:Flp pilus assembly pilin Flp
MNWGNHLRDQRGQTSVEYALVVAVALTIAILLAGVLANGVFDTFWSTVTDALSSL